MSRSIKYGINITYGNLTATNIVSTSVTAGGIHATDVTTGNINVIGNLYQNGDVYVPSGGGGVSSQWTSTNGNLYYKTTAGNSFVGINTSTPTSSLDVIGSARFTIGLTTGSIMATGLVSAANIKSTTTSVGNLLNSSLRSTNATISNLNIVGINTGNMVAINETITNATITNMNILGATAGSLVVNNINAVNATISNAVATNVTVSNIQATSASTTNIVGTNVTASDINSTSITASNITSTNVSSENTTIGNVVTNMSSTNIHLTNANVSNISTVNSNTNYFNVDNLITQTASTDIVANNINAVSETVGNILSNNVSTINSSISNLLATDIVFTNITSGNFDVSKLDLTNATATNETVTNLIATNTTAINTTINNLQNTNSTINNIISTNVSNANVTTGSILATELGSLNIASTNSSINNLNSVNSSVGNVLATNVNITNVTTENMFSTNATVDKLIADNIITTDASIETVIASTGITTANITIRIVENQNIVLANQGMIGANNIAMQYQIGSGTSGSHVFYTNSTTGQSNEAMGTERMRINGSGNIGIGTNAPSNKLHVVGDVLVDGIIYSDIQATNISASSLIASGFNNTLGSIFTNGYNIGIGVSNPETTLHIGPSAEQMITLNNDTSYTGLGVSNSTMNYMGGTNADHVFYKESSLGDTGIETMRVDKDGKLTVTSISTGSVNYVNSTAGSLSTLQNATATNITASSITTPTEMALSVASVTTGNISASNNTRVKGNVFVNGSLTAVNVTTVNLIHNNISASTLVITGLSNLNNVTTTNISSSSYYIYNSATSGTTNYAMTALANINPGNRVGTIMGKSSGYMSGIYTWYEHIGNNNLSNYVHHDFNGFNDVFVMNARGRVGFATNNPTNTLHVSANGFSTGDVSARVSSFVTTSNLITNNISTGTLIASNLSSLQNVTATNETLASLTVTSIRTASVLATGLVSATNLAASNTTIQNAVLTNLSASLNVTGTSRLQNATSTNVSASTLVSTGLSALQNITSTNISASTLVASGLTSLQNVSATNVTLATLMATTGVTTASLLATGLASAVNLAASNTTIQNAVLTNLSASLNVTSTSGLQNVTGTNVSASTLTASGLSALQNVTGTNISANTLTASGLSGLQNVIATNETLATLNVTGITSVSLLATGLVSVANLSITNYTFPNINLTNTNVTVSSLIVSGSSSLRNASLTNVTMTNLVSPLITTTALISTNITTESMFINGGSSGTAGTLLGTRMFANITTGSRIGGFLGKSETGVNSLYGWYEHLGDSNTSNYVHYDFFGFNNMLTLNAKGRVGLSTVNPSNTLHVNGTALISGLITTSNLMATSLSYNNNSQFIINSGAVTSQNIMLTNVSGGGVINFADGHHAIWGGIGADGARNEMQFREYGVFDFANGGALASQTSDLFIGFNGNVGINAINVANKLHVNGILRVNNSITTGSLFAQDLTANGIVSLRSTRGILIGSSTNIDDRRLISALDSGMLSGQARWLSFGQAASLNNQAELAFVYAGSGSTQNGISLGFFGGEKMRIQATGFVGIGTAAPTCILDLNGAGSNQFNLTDTVSGARLRAVAFTDTKTYMQTPGDMVFTQIDDDSFARMTVATRGNVGIRTSNPTSRMAVQYNSSVNSNENTPNGIQINSSSGITTASLYMGADATNDGGRGYIQASKQNANLALALNPRGGNVGIGTTNPTSKLHVNGSLAKSSGTFDIKHPLKENTRLVHSFVEAPRCDLIYRGSKQLVNGQVIVDINMECTHSANGGMSPGTFEALCGNPQVFVRSNTSFEELIGSVSGGELTIQSNDTASNTVIEWMVIAERIDPDIKTWNRTDQNGFLITEYVV